MNTSRASVYGSSQYQLRQRTVLHATPTRYSIEILTWKLQESALVIARLLLPQIFEKMAMHEIRVPIAERSTMNIYIKGEDIELEQNYIGILLEGFLKTKNQNLITPPGVLLLSNTDLTKFGLESSDYYYTAPSYQVEARTRIIFFEISRVPEAEAGLQRTASLLSQTHEPPRTLSKEHSGLLRWPESFRKSRGPHNVSFAETRNQPGSFSARALQLSMYGSMINDMHSGQGQRHRSHAGNEPEAQLLLPPSAVKAVRRAASALRAVGGFQHEECYESK
ncbi:sodium/hydrogen exchanger 7-like [Phragmites australis]|uniref:sodium/hydrogen exchanger 7-like n=1 Tax=Phragmites australis TaxID=29695 RepID=UPI002D77780A|nr:sodium/hydrogen exchanger 7-like [Phragmites australis]